MATHVERVVAFGGSGILGIGANGFGWVQMLHERYRELNEDLGVVPRPRIFYELGIFAAKAHHIASNIATEIDKRLWIPGEDGGYDPLKRLAIISIGTNDSTALPDGGNLTPLEAFKKSVGTIADTLAERSKVLYVGLSPRDERKWGDFWGVENPRSQFEARLEYEAAAIEIFRAAGAVAIPMAAEAYKSREYMDDIVADGMHVGPCGEAWAFRRVVPYFERSVSVQLAHGT